jgi:hypothetical protein
VGGSVVGDGLGVIAGARGDYPACFLFRREREDTVERAAFLEGASALQVIELEENGLAGERGERDGVRRGGAVDAGADTLARGQHIGERDGERWGGFR